MKYLKLYESFYDDVEDYKSISYGEYSNIYTNIWGSKPNVMDDNLIVKIRSILESSDVRYNIIVNKLGYVVSSRSRQRGLSSHQYIRAEIIYDDVNRHTWDYKILDIYALEDEWFLVNFSKSVVASPDKVGKPSKTIDHYICDGLYGLESLIGSI